MLKVTIENLHDGTFRVSLGTTSFDVCRREVRDLEGFEVSPIVREIVIGMVARYRHLAAYTHTYIM